MLGDPGLVALAFGSALCYALGLVLTQFGLRSETPVGGACLSVPTTALILIALSPWTIDWGGFQPRSAALFAGIGLVFPAAATLMTFAANRLIGPSITGALGNLTPVFAILTALVVLGEVPTGAQTLGIAAVTAGVAVMLLGPGTLRSGAAWWVFLLPLAVAFLRSVAQTVIKAGLQDWPNPFAAVTLGYIVSATVILFYATSRGQLPQRIWTRDRLWFVAIGVANGGALLFLYAALARGPVAVVSALVATFPLMTVALSALLIRTLPVTRALVAGVTVTVAGIVVLLIG